MIISEFIDLALQQQSLEVSNLTGAKSGARGYDCLTLSCRNWIMESQRELLLLSTSILTDNTYQNLTQATLALNFLR